MKVVDVEPLIEFYKSANAEDLDPQQIIPDLIRNLESMTEYSADPDQVAKADAGKIRLTLVPRDLIWAVASIREYGCKKYPEGGPDNWKQVEVERYRDAAFRHFMHYLDDPHGADEDSGLPHLWHLACNIAFLCSLEDEAIREEIERIEDAS